LEQFIMPFLTIVILVSLLYVVQNPSIMFERFSNEQNKNQEWIQERRKGYTKYPFL
jgi:hypothetical protein